MHVRVSYLNGRMSLRVSLKQSHKDMHDWSPSRERALLSKQQKSKIQAVLESYKLLDLLG